MASKINRKFILVIGGFSAAAVLLLVAVILVNQLWLKNADRHIRSGDELMAQGKPREAFAMYGRAVAKKPDNVSYIEKMESALGAVVATTAAQSSEDYRNLMALKRSHTRAQPGDPEQWRILILALRNEAELYSRGDGWLAIESIGKEMKEVMAPGSDGMRLAEETILYARAQRDGVLTAGERTDLERQLVDFLKVAPKSWRGWSALASIRTADVARLRGQGQEQASTRRKEALDKTLVDMRAALQGGDALVQAALASAELDRLLVEARVGKRIDPTKKDEVQVKAAADALAAAALASGDGVMVHASVGKIVEAKDMDAGIKMLEEWLTTHPKDMIGASLALELVSRMSDQESGFERTRQAARRITEQPTLPTSLDASVQPETRARAVQVLIESAIIQASRPGQEAKKEELAKEIVALRGQLLLSLQNDESSPSMLAVDAKISQFKGDLPSAAKKWETYFGKVPQPTADAFLWYTTVSRAQNDLGLAMTTVSKGTDAFPNDMRLVVQRAELAAALGRFAEAATLFEALAAAVPSDEKLAAMAAEARNRADGKVAQAAPEIAQLDAAIAAKNYPQARELAAKWAQSSKDALQALYAQALVEQQAGDKAKSLEFLRAALIKYPGNAELAKMEAMLTTEDPLARVDMMLERMVPDPKRRSFERVRALRGLVSDIERQTLELRRANSPELARSEEFLAKVKAALPEAEKQAQASGMDDPATIELAFGDALSRKDFAAAEIHLAAAAKMSATAPMLEVVLRARWLDAQGRTAEAVALLEKARQSGRLESPVAAQLATIQEKIGNEPAALALWKEAYDRRPNDPVNVRGYARALGRSGQGRIALDMLRAAVAANPGDLETLYSASQYEAVYGSRATAIDLRMRIMQVDGGNRENVGELYGLYYLPPDFGSVKGPDGRPRFDARAWASVPPDEQRRLLADAQQMNYALAEQLYAAAMKAAPLDIGFAGRKAAVMNGMGKSAEGIKALQEVMTRAEADGKATANMYTEYALYLDAMGNREGADAAFKKGAALQDPKRREVDLVLVEFESKRGNTKRAIELLTSVLGDAPPIGGLIRLADLQLIVRDYTGGQKTVEQIRSLLGASPAAETQRQYEMLVSGVAAGQADELRNAGKTVESQAKVAEALAALVRAETVAPADLLAPLRRVQILRGISVAGQDPTKLDAAIAEADRALARNAMNWQMVSLRADLALDKRDIKAAIGIIERFLQAQPASDEARVRLAEMQVASANIPRAIEMIRGGVALHPDDPLWAERLGDAYQGSGNSAAAATEYERAFTLAPTNLVTLEKAANARLTAGGAAETLVLIRGAGDLLSRSPALQAISAVALSRSGKRDQAIIQGRDALIAARKLTGDAAVQAVERTLVVLRDMFPNKPADFETFLVQSGSVTPIEATILADSWVRIGPDGATKALEWCNKVNTSDETIPIGVRAAVEMTRGTVFYGKPDLPAAATAFERAAVLTPGSPGALNNAAYLMSKLNKDPSKAFEYATRAVLLAPAQPDYLDTLGYILLQAGRLAEAEDALNKSVAASPTTSAILHLAQTRAAQGSIGDARQLLDRARARTNDDETKKEIETFAATLQGK